jgi:predicted porin
MNKTLIVAAVSALAAGGALAQSSVTVYGRVNLTVEQTELADKKIVKVENNASRIGFKGTEDLGGGLKANFILEHGFNIDNGAASGAFWGRQSEVNLAGGFGMVRLGNFTSEAYFATADYISMHNHDTGNSEDKLYAYLGRNGNKIAYRTPEFIKGLTAEAAISLGEGAPGQTRTYDGAINYAMGPLQLGFGMERNNGSEQYAVRGLYEFGAFVAGAYVQQHKDKTLGDRTLWRLSGAFNMGASEFHVNFGQAGEFDKLADSDATQFTLGYNYNLSKRTKVYTYYTKVDDSKGVSGFGADFQSFAVGVRHNF